MNVRRAEDSDSDSEWPRKRQRLSSPTYDEQFELSQDDVKAFDMFEQKLSQALSSPLKPSQKLSSQARPQRGFEVASALSRSKGTADHASLSIPGFQSAASIHGPQSPTKPLKASGFSSALDIETNGSSSQMPLSSPVGPPERDLSAWFESSDIPEGGLMFKSAKDLAVDPQDPGGDWLNAPPPPGTLLGFQSAKDVKPLIDDIREQSPPSSTPTPAFAGFVSGASVAQSNRNEDDHDDKQTDDVPKFVGFASGSSLLNPAKKATSWSAPTSDALAKAAERMRQWQAEIDAELTGDDVPREPTEPSSSRIVLDTIENSFISGSLPPSQAEAPETPTPVRIMPMPLGSLKSAGVLDKRKPFKSPLKVPQKNGNVSGSVAAASYVASPFNPSRASSSALPQSKAFAPLKPLFPATPTRPIAGPSSPPKRSLGTTPRRFAGSPMSKPAFVTPFKAGMKPKDLGRTQKNTPQPQIVLKGPYTSSAKKDKGKGRAVYFNLASPPSRQTLASSGLVPQAYTDDELAAMGVDIDQLSQITPSIAHYYRFHSAPDSSTSTLETRTLGPEEAYQELCSLGCDLVTQPWVDNHWGLILWKLAGMACLEPKREQNSGTKRWCWGEVMRQLRYRYERELNRGTRPPLRLIAAHDAPVGLPMVLCISRIEWPEGSLDSEGEPFVSAQPLVEVTDGWYRVRAEVDAAMAFAVRKGSLRCGMKVGLVGARFTDYRTEPFEILEKPFAAITSDSALALRLTGNACHLVPWHAKLGFQRDPFVATLASLVPNGGRVSVMDLVVVKAHPIAWIEFFDTDGGRTHEAPKLEAEESRARAEWQARRDSAAERIRTKLEKTLHDLERHADRLEIKAGMSFNPRPDDSPPDDIEDLLDTLEEACSNARPLTSPQDIIKRTSKEDAGWLARAIHEKCAKDRERMGEEIEKELDSECPPRDVKDFRVLVMQDAQTRKRDVQMAVQITVWDVLSQYTNEDGKPGEFKEGERFIVTNLEPTKPTAWMQREDGAMIYMLTRKDTRWRKVR